MNDHDLITAMRESFTDVQSATPVEQIVSRSRVISARRRITGAVAVAAVAAAAVTAVALIPSGPAKPAPAATQRTAYVVSHVAQALDAMPRNTVVFMQQTTVPARQTMDRWERPNGGGQRFEIFTPAGQPVSDSRTSFSGPVSRLTRRVVFVDYQNKTWWRTVLYFGNGNSGLPTVWTCSNANNEDLIGDAREMAAQLRTELSCGELKVVGSGTADGVPAVKLSKDFGSGAVTYWVNATTYLLFRVTWTQRGYPTQQVKLQWLPPTAANLAKLNVPIPPRFTQVPPPPGMQPSSRART
jgi:hypothetical protein